MNNDTKATSAKKKIRKFDPDTPLYRKGFNFQPNRGDIRRVEILNGAIRCILEKGIQNTNLEAVAKTCRLKRAHVVYYFDSTEALIEAVIQFAMTVGYEKVVETLQANPGRDPLENYVRGHFAWANDEPELLTIYALTFFYAGVSPKFKALQHQIRAVGRERIEAMLAGRRTPGSKAGANPEAATLIQAIITSMLIDALGTNRFSSIAEAEKLCLDLALRSLSL